MRITTQEQLDRKKNKNRIKKYGMYELHHNGKNKSYRIRARENSVPLYVPQPEPREQTLNFASQNPLVKAADRCDAL
ncbi:hypothetical protein [uncultured Methanoregula sp.]|uniref:hypothetical protein n=1 Tax=uncultured Methanoregula sp. TaxID=1005933 RepID=UPI002AABD94B|nr:hypothetical protein [uncultured Methanoregula sp.]